MWWEISSFQMMHSEIMTIMQERKKVNILIFDNCGFGCINNLENDPTLDRVLSSAILTERSPQEI